MPQKNLKRVTTSKKKTTKNNIKFKPAKIQIVDHFNNMTPKQIDEFWDKAFKVDEKEQALFDRYKLQKPSRKIPKEARMLIHKMAKELGYWKDENVIDLVNGPGRPGKWVNIFGWTFYNRVQEQKQQTPQQTTNACIRIVKNKKEYQNDYGDIPVKTLQARYKELKKKYEQCKEIIDALKEYEPDLQELAKQIQ